MKNKHFSNNINIGNLIILIGFLVAVPLLVPPFYPSESRYLFAFAVPSVLSVVIGALISRLSKKDDTVTHWRINMQNSSLTVLLAWIYGFAAGAGPFVIAGKLDPLRAFFEAVSGWTTTGMTMLDLSVTPKIFLFHRSFMQFCGALGFVLVMLMFIQGKQSMTLYSAEGHPDKLIANVRKTARLIFYMYISFALIGTLSYRISGMDFFDALLHSMCALATGGASPQPSSLSAYDSVAVEVITIILMLVGATNFAVLLLLAKRKLRQVIRMSEIRFMLILMLLVIPATAFSFMRDMDIFSAFRHSALNTVSAFSTTGYSTISFNDLPQFALGIFIILMLVGGGMGSTAGGIKLLRIYILLRIMAHNFQRKVSPTRKVDAPHYMKAQGNELIDAETVSDTAGFFLTYIAVFVIGTFTLTLSAGWSLLEAGFEFASALGNVGMSIGIASADSGAITLITLIIGMILGRLEIFIVLIGVYSGFRLSKEKIESLVERRRVSVKNGLAARRKENSAE